MCGLVLGVPRIDEMMFFLDARCGLRASSCDSPRRWMWILNSGRAASTARAKLSSLLIGNRSPSLGSAQQENTSSWAFPPVYLVSFWFSYVN